MKKKFTHLLTALLLAVGTTATAQTADNLVIASYGDAVTSVADIESGAYYVLLNTTHSSYNGYAYVKKHECAFDQTPDRVGISGSTALPATGTLAEGIVLQLTETDGSYTMKFYGTDYYIANQDASSISSSQGYPVHVTDDATKATFTVATSDDYLTFTSTQANDDGKIYLNVGGVDGGGFSLWTSAANFSLYPVTLGESVSVSGTAVTSTDALTDGYYIIKGARVDGSNNGSYVHYNPDASDSRYYRLGDAVTNESETIDDDNYNYVWKLVNNTENGTFTLQNVMYGTYFIADENSGGNFTGTETANLQIVVEDGTTQRDDGTYATAGWYMTMTNYLHNDVATHLCVNQPGDGYGDNLSWWQNIGNPAHLLLEFYPVTGLAEVTYNYTYGGEVKATETFTVNLNASDAFPEPTTLPSFVAYTLPEGTVTEGGTYEIQCTLSDDNPFTISESYDSDDAAWYALTISGSYYFVGNPGDEATYIPLTATTLIPESADELADYLWCFVGNPFDGYRLYNRSSNGKILSASTTNTDGNTGGNTYPLLYDEGSLPEGYNTLWDVVSTTSISGVNGFFLTQHGYSSSTHSMNNRSNVLAFRNQGAGAGSTFVTYDANALYEQQNIASYFPIAEVEGAVGTYVNDVFGEYVNNIANFDAGTGTWDDYATLCAASYTLDLEGEPRVELVPGGWYRIQNYVRKASTKNTNNPGDGGYLEVVDHLENSAWSAIEMVANDTAASRSLALWKFVESDTDGEYYLYNLNAEVYAGYASTTSTVYVPTSETTDDAGLFTVTSYNTGQSLIATADNNYQLHASGANANNPAGVMLYNAGANSASAWYITPATTIDLTVSAAGWATANYPFAVELPEGLAAYTVTGKSDDGETVYLTEAGSTIPANTPVLLEGEAATYTLNLLPDNTDAAPDDNLLSGTTMYETLNDGVDAYVLAQVGDDEVGFYRVETSDDVEEGETPDRTVKANRAYYVATDGPTGSNALRFSFGDAGTTTGISTATPPTTDGQKVYYDLNGRRVLYPSRGIYVTADGQKVFIK